MVYSKRGSKYAARRYGGSKRYSRGYRTVKKATSIAAARTRVFKKRKATPTRNKRQVVRNTRAIKKLKSESYGSYQMQRQMIENSFLVTASKPCILQANNLAAAGDGPAFSHGTASDGHIYTTFARLAPFAVATGLDLGDEDDITRHANRKPNGPVLKWNFAEYQFEVRGHVDNTYVDFWVVQEKFVKRQLDYWNENTSSRPSHLPYTAKMFEGISGFGAPQFNHKYFKCLKHKRVFLNSKGDYSANDAAEQATNNASHRYTTPGTTPAVKHVNLKWRPNQVMRQLESSMAHEEDGMLEFPNFDANPNTNASTGAWGWENMIPSRNTWIVITTSDVAQQSGFDGHQISINCIRRNVWQDKLG